MTTDPDLAQALNRLLSERLLNEHEEAALADILATLPDGQWAAVKHGPSDWAESVLDARALAGLFILDEDVLWSAATGATIAAAFARLRRLIEANEAFSRSVARMSAANGGQRITTRSGRWLRFAMRPHGVRGVSADCHIAQEYANEEQGALVLNVLTRPNPQLLIQWRNR